MKYSGFKGIVFDLDYTLYDEGEYFYFVFEKFCKDLECYEKLYLMKEHFPSLRRESKDIFEDILGVAKFKDDRSKLKRELFLHYVSLDAVIKPYENVVSLLEDLKDRKIRVGMLTNGVIEAQKNKIRCLGISHFFDEIFFARELGKDLEKPNRLAFQEISKRLDIEASRLIFVGDNPDKDFKGAKELGGFNIRLKRGIYSDVHRNDFIDLEIEDLRELEDFHGW